MSAEIRNGVEAIAAFNRNTRALNRRILFLRIVRAIPVIGKRLVPNPPAIQKYSSLKEIQKAVQDPAGQQGSLNVVEYINPKYLNRKSEGTAEKEV
jgi:hypothetical protein